MPEIKRYGLRQLPGDVPTASPNGNWVRYPDYEKLEAVERDIRVRAEDRLERLEEAEEKLDQARQQRDQAREQRDEELRERLEAKVEKHEATHREEEHPFTADFERAKAEAVQEVIDSIFEEAGF